MPKRLFGSATRWAPLLFVALLLFCFGVIAQEVIEGEPLGFDRTVMLAMRNAADPSLPLGPRWLQEAARDITALGSTLVVGMVLLVVTLYLFLDGKRHAGWLVLIAVLGGALLNHLLKLGFARPRPDLFPASTQVFTLSFPSGHAALSAICYLTLGALLAQTQSRRAIRFHFVATAAALTLAIGISRIYLGVHYPTDVLAGWCIGAAWALLCWTVMNHFQRKGQIEPPGG